MPATGYIVAIVALTRSWIEKVSDCMNSASEHVNICAAEVQARVATMNDATVGN